MSLVLSQILLLSLLILINGLLSMSEIAIISARKTRLQQLADEGDHQAREALALAATPNRFLSTVQVGITLIGVLAGAVSGATLGEELAVYVSMVPWLHPYAGAVSITIVVVLITFFSLVLGELVPKRLALNRPERIARAVAAPMRALSVVAAPLVRLLSLSTDLFLRLLGVHPSEEPPVTEEELRVLLEQGTEAGVFQEVEQDMVESVLHLGDRRVMSMMTPRPDIIWLDVEDSPEMIQAKITASSYSRFPVGQGSLDQILGEVQTKDLLAHSLAGQPFDLRAVLRDPLYVPETMSALRVLEAFRQSGTAMALALDEYGSVQGLVTLTDILESIVGDIPSGDEEEDPQVVQREDGSWLLDGMLPVEELKELLNLDQLPGEEQGLFQTVAGFVVSLIGRIPTTADHAAWRSWRFEVVDMDGQRVDKILVSPLPAAGEADELLEQQSEP
jgi:putative hemolysin